MPGPSVRPLIHAVTLEHEVIHKIGIIIFIFLLWKLIGILKDLTLKKYSIWNFSCTCTVPKLLMQSTKQNVSLYARRRI